MNRLDVLDMIEKIKNNTNQLSDEEIVLNVRLFIPSYNCNAAAMGYFSIIPSISLQKPQLKEELIKIALLPLYYEGLETYEQMRKWIEWYAKQEDYYAAGKEEKEWLLEEFKNKELIESLLNEIIKKEYEEIN